MNTIRVITITAFITKRIITTPTVTTGRSRNTRPAYAVVLPGGTNPAGDQDGYQRPMPGSWPVLLRHTPHLMEKGE
jgi:hypothetical protein